LVSKIFDIGVDSLKDEEDTWVYKLKVDYEISPHTSKALARPLALYVVPRLTEELDVNVIASVYLNYKNRIRRVLTIIGIKNPSSSFVTLTTVLSPKDDKLSKEEALKILKKRNHQPRDMRTMH
jgi:hypothetical protein